MKIKVLILLLILTSLTGYLEWGASNSSFLFQAEYEVMIRLATDPESVVHPFILLPLFGQLLLLFSLFQKNPNKIIIYSAIGCLGLLLGFMFIIGLLGLNVKILASSFPFLLIAFLTVRQLRTGRQQEPKQEPV